MFEWLTSIWSKNYTRGRGVNIPRFGSTAGETVTNQSASTVSSYFAAIRNISEDIGKIPSPIYNIDAKGDKTKATNHPAYKLLNIRPNSMMTAFTLKELLTSWALGWGNGFAEIVFDNRMNPVQMWPIHPARVSPFVDKEQKLFYYVYPDYDIRYGETVQLGDPIVLADFQMFHLKGPTEYGVWGKSVLGSMAESLGISIASQKYGAAFYGNGSNAGGFLSHPTQISEEAGLRLKQSVESGHKGAGKSGGIMVIEEGMKFESTTVNPKDAQALELRQFQVIEIARWFRIQPHKIQELNQANYANLESQNLDYVTDTLLSWSTRFEQEAQNKLLLDDPKLSCDFDFAFLLKGDQAARASYYNTLHFIGVLNSNEIRRAEGMNSIGPKGDEYYQQSAMVPLGSVDSGQASAFNTVAVNAAQKVSSKEMRACGAEKKKDRDHSSWAKDFWVDQLDFAVNSFMPIYTTMDQLSLCDGANSIEAFTIGIKEAYQDRELVPLTSQQILEIYDSSKR